MSSEETAPVRVALVDDQALIRSGLAMLVDSQPDLTVVAEAGSGREAVASVSVAGADVVLMDVRMPEMDGIEATRALLRRPDAPRVVVLTTFDLDEYAFDAIEAGASGFLLKDAPPEELLAAIRTVHRGDAVIAPSTTRRLLTHMAPRLRSDQVRSAECEEQQAAVASLTPREHEVLVLMAQGAANLEIAAELVLSEATVKTHVGRVLAKLGARDRVQAVLIAHRAGLDGRPGRRGPCLRPSPGTCQHNHRSYLGMSRAPRGSSSWPCRCAHPLRDAGRRPRNGSAAGVHAPTAAPARRALEERHHDRQHPGPPHPDDVPRLRPSRRAGAAGQ